MIGTHARASAARGQSIGRDGLVVLSLVAVLSLAACDRKAESTLSSDSVPSAPAPSSEDIPRPDLTDMEPRVQFMIRDAQARVNAKLGNAAEWGRYGMVLDAHEVHDAAIVAYRWAGSLAPREFRWRYLLAHVLELQEFEAIDIDAVEAALMAARDVNQTYAPLYVRLGGVLTQLGRHEEAQPVFERAIFLDETIVSAHTGLTRALLAQGKTEAGLERIEACALNYPRNWEVQLLLARALAVAGKRDEARRAAARARELPQKAEYPDPLVSEMMNHAVSATACFKRARALSGRGDFDNAVMNLKVVVEVKPDYAAAHERLAWCYLEMEKPKAARRHFKLATELAPEMVAAHLGLASALEALGLPAEAEVAHATGVRLQTNGER